MKKCWMRMVALALCLLLTGSCALAEVESGVMPERDGDGDYMRVSDVAVAGDTAYMLAYCGGYMSLWRWQSGMEEAVPVKEDFFRADEVTPGSVLAGAGDGPKYAIAAIVSDGERLYGVNPANGLVFAINVTESGAELTDVVTLARTDLFYRHSRSGDYYVNPVAAAASGGYLYWLGTGWDAATQSNRLQLVRFSLADGSAEEVEAFRPTTICTAPDGKLYILGRPVSEGEDNDQQPYVLSLYDPADGSITPVGCIDTTRAVYCMAYAPALDSILWQEGTNILGMQGLGEEQLYAYVPTTSSGDLAVLGDELILTLTGRTIVRQLVPGLTVPDSLQVMHGSFDLAATAFADLYPDVPVEIINDSAQEGYGPWFAPPNDGQRVDVLRLYTSTEDLDFITLRDAGMLLDLSVDPEIVAYVNDLYPPFRELVTGENGEIWAVPTETVSYTGFFVNRRAMQAMGLTEKDMPTNLVELCAFITMWDAQYADRFPNYTCLDSVPDARRYLADLAIHMWIGHCQATGQPLHFDDPAFREVMDAIAAVSTVRSDAGMAVVNPEISDYKSGLFWLDCQLVGNWAAYMEDYSDRIFIPLTLTADTPYHAEVQGVELWVVNAGSESTEYAICFICQEIAQVNDKYAHVLLTSRTEAVPSPYFAESLAYEQRALGEMRMELLRAETPQRVAELERMIAEKEAYIATELQRGKYTITPSAVENYVNVLAPAMYIQRYNPLQFTAEGVRALEYVRDRWLEGVITTEQLVRELDARLLMLELAQ